MASSTAASDLLLFAESHGMIDTGALLAKLSQQLQETSDKASDTENPTETLKLLETAQLVLSQCGSVGEQSFSSSASRLHVSGVALLEHFSRVGDSSMVAALVKFLLSTFRHVNLELQDQFISTCTRSLREHAEERQFACGNDSSCHHQSALDVHIALDALRHVLNDPSSHLGQGVKVDLIRTATESLFHVDDDVCGKIIATVLPLLMTNSDFPTQQTILEQTVKAICEIFEKFGQKTFRTKNVHALSERPFLIACGLADWLFPLDDVMKGSTITLPAFWRLLQSGLFHFNPLTRKRAQYLLKRVLDTVEQQGQSC